MPSKDIKTATDSPSKASLTKGMSACGGIRLAMPIFSSVPRPTSDYRDGFQAMILLAIICIKSNTFKMDISWTAPFVSGIRPQKPLVELKLVN
jgi:hypothetical protein